VIDATPAAEVAVDEALVRSLLREQHPDLADLPLRPVTSGWDNFLFRLGDALAIRLPRRAVAAALVEHEQRWLPTIAGRLPLPIPSPVRTGVPSAEYPWRWSVVPWLAGEPAEVAPPRADQASVLAGFLRALHAPAPGDAPRNPYRGVALRERAAAVEERFRRLEQRTSAITPQIRAAWQQALAAPIDMGERWLHGDLHAGNVLVDGGRLSAVIDWGDMAQGDPPTDLASVWMLLPDVAAREAAMEAYGPASAATWQRARGWAVFFGVTLLDTGLVDDPRHAAAGERTLRRVSDELARRGSG